MSKVTVKSRFDITRMIGPEFGAEFQNRLGETLLEEMKNDISKGNSPVRTERRFEPYKNPEKYPAGKKPNRPVNLHLTGEMLQYLKFKPVTGRPAVDVGYLNAPHDVQVRAIAHNTGTGDMAQRKHIPWESGDELTVRITRRMIDVYKERLARLIQKGNK